jgi:hypothetical protein
MRSSQVLWYHVLVPAGAFVILLVVGAPLGPALVVGMMTGCMSMMVIPGRGLLPWRGVGGMAPSR